MELKSFDFRKKSKIAQTTSSVAGFNGAEVFRLQKEAKANGTYDSIPSFNGAEVFRLQKVWADNAE